MRANLVGCGQTVKKNSQNAGQISQTNPTSEKERTGSLWLPYSTSINDDGDDGDEPLPVVALESWAGRQFSYTDILTWNDRRSRLSKVKE